jgi:hypothetical protein
MQSRKPLTKRSALLLAVSYAVALRTLAYSGRFANMRSRTDSMRSRRDFLKTGGALIVSFNALNAQGPFDTHQSHIDPSMLDSWLAVGAGGSVTAHTGKRDFGQGIRSEIHGRGWPKHNTQPYAVVPKAQHVTGTLGGRKLADC